MSDPMSDPKWEALRRECATVAQHLGLGATSIGKARYEQTATYTQAFFALSVGFERGAKVALTLDAALTNNGRFLTTTELRRYGHRLADLLQAMEEIAARRGISPSAAPSDDIHRAIIGVLTNFASNVTRYYNLEALTPDGAKAADPIAAWYETVTTRVAQRHYSTEQRRKDEARAAAITVSASTFVSVIATSETGDAIADLSQLAERTSEANVTKPWERMYVLQLARFVTRVVGRLGSQAQQAGLAVPFLDEYFYLFQREDHDFRNRKVWLIEP
jgi:hypothetical protein